VNVFHLITKTCKLACQVIFRDQRNCLEKVLNQLACEQAPEDGKNFGERETEEFREQSDRAHREPVRGSWLVYDDLTDVIQ